MTLAIETVPVTLLRQNCLVLSDRDRDDSCVVVDPGGDVPDIVARLSGRRLDQIWLTHGHLDHAGGVAELVRVLADQDGGPPRVIGPDRRDAFLLASISAQSAQFGLSGMEDARSDRFLTEGETVSVGGHDFEVMHVPGHTPGHVVFVDRASRLAIVGDTLFRAGIGRTDFPYGDPAVLLAAIRDKLLPLGDDMRFLCGHGPGSSIGVERRTNPFLQGLT